MVPWVLAFVLILSPTALAFPLESPAFQRLVKDSYDQVPGAPSFLDWLKSAYRKGFARTSPGGYPGDLEEALRQLSHRPPVEAATWAFQVVKRLLPQFSLEEGYEFAYATLKGERQCLLQATLVQGLLESMGFSAGIYMVWKNPEGRESNLGHAVAVLRLKGKDYLVDPSEPIPFPRHLGVFLNTKEGYRFAEPIYAWDGAIVAYRIHGRRWLPDEVGPLPYAFVRSQFYYYRGEQARGGVLKPPRTPTGLARSEAMLRKAVALDPRNPLARYLLGLTLAKEGRGMEAKSLLLEAHALYRAYGHVPRSVAAILKGL